MATGIIKKTNILNLLFKNTNKYVNVDIMLFRVYLIANRLIFLIIYHPDL